MQSDAAQSTHTRSDALASGGALPRAASHAAAGPLAALESALDELHDTGAPFLACFEVLDFLSRRTGGQGCVQFVRRTPDRAQFAVKFFPHADGAFSRELDLYSTPALRAVLPAALRMCPNSDGAVRSPSGYAFPPFIIVERGEALNEWASRSAPDFATALFVLLHVAERLQRLHAAGLCHRDIKPANILWRPLSNSWTLIDYGCAATIGALRLHVLQWASLSSTPCVC